MIFLQTLNKRVRFLEDQAFDGLQCIQYISSTVGCKRSSAGGIADAQGLAMAPQGTVGLQRKEDQTYSYPRLITSNDHIKNNQVGGHC